MPRPERPVDPSAGAVPRFAYELRKLRAEAGGPTYRELAARAGYSVTTLSHAAGGRQLPSLDVALAYATACGGDRDDWSARWHDAALTVTEDRTSHDESGRAPYRGLASFRADDADLFFGRDGLVADVVAELDEHRLAVVIGASGAGKTSLVAAGVLPALCGRDGVVSAIVRPGDLAAVEQSVAELPDRGRLVLVVDQFEELFARCDHAEREAFVDAVLDLPDRDCMVILGVRADFYGRCAEHRRLATALRGHQVLVTPMNADELHTAISRPALAVGLSVERALLAAVTADAEGRPGVLPLVSHAMLETWRRRRGDVLTLTGYQSAGGVRGALLHTAEAAYGGLTERRQQLAAELLLRMITMDGELVTRRRADLAELLDTDPDAAAVLGILAEARLVTMAGDIDGDRVEITHEALIEHWPRLREWLAEDREGLHTHHQLTEAARTWQSLDQDPSVLYRGARLAVATDRARRRHVHLTGVEREFLDTSAAAEDRRITTERRRTTLLRRLTTALAVFSVLALAATVIAAVQANRAADAGTQARSRQLAAEARLLADTDTEAALRAAVDAYDTAPTGEARSVLLSLAGTLAFHDRFSGHSGGITALAVTPDATTMVSGGEDGTAVVWDLPRRRQRHTLDTGRQVRDLAVSPDGTRVVTAGRDRSLAVWRVSDGTQLARLSGHRGSVESVAFGADGRTLVSVDSTRTAIVWDATTHRRRATVAGHGGMDSAVAVSPDGTTAAIAGDDGQVTVVDLATGQVRESLPVGTPLHAVAFHPRDGSLVTAGNTDTLTLFDRDRRRHDLDTDTGDQVHDLAFQADGRRLLCACGRQTLTFDPAGRTRESGLGVRTGAVNAVATSEDGGILVSAGADGATLLWNRARLPLHGHTGGVRGLAVSPDGATLASAGTEGVVGVWTTRDRAPRALLPAHTQAVNSVAIHPDGRLIASASNYHTVAVWDPVTSKRTAVLPGDDRVRGIDFHPDGQSVAYGGADGRVLRGELDGTGEPARIHRHRGPVHTLAFSPDGRHLASAGQDGKVLLTDLTRPGGARTLAGPGARIDALAFSPDGRHLAVGAGTDILVWDIRAGGSPSRLTGHSQPVTALAFSPGGRFLASGGDQQAVIVWDFPGRARWTTLTGHTDKVLSAVWSPDGSTLYTGGADHTIIPWTVDPGEAHRRLLGQLGPEPTGS